MPKPEWGTKRTCGECDAKFYDFRKNPIICPNCETEFVLNTPAARKKPAEAPKAVVAEKAAKPLDDSDEDFDDVGEIDDDSMLLDDDDDEEYEADPEANVI